MKRAIFINLVILFCLLLVALSPVLVGAAMVRLGESYGCTMSGAGDLGPDPCATIVGILFVAGWSAIAVVPIGAGLLLVYILGVAVYFVTSWVRGRRIGQGPSPAARGMLFSTLVAALAIAVLVGIVAGISWYRTSFISACKSLPAAAPLTSLQNGAIAVSARLSSAATDEMRSILLLTPDGRILNRADNLRRAGDPAWSPDGQRLAFVARSWDTGQFGLYWMDRQAQVGPPLFPDDRLEIRSPDWIPDGGLIFERWVENDGRFDSEIFVAPNQDYSSDVAQLLSFPGSPKYDGQPRVSPDGRQIIFVSRRDGQPDIYRMDMDGANVVRLTRGIDEDIDPAWSPDGRWIVFASNRDRTGSRNNYSLYVMAPDGTNQCRLTQGDGSYTRPVWSPDGLWIAYISLLENKLYLVHPDGTGTAILPLSEALSGLYGLDWAAESGR